MLIVIELFGLWAKCKEKKISLHEINTSSKHAKMQRTMQKDLGKATEYIVWPIANESEGKTNRKRFWRGKRLPYMKYLLKKCKEQCQREQTLLNIQCGKTCQICL